MAWNTIRSNVTVTFPYLTITGDIEYDSVQDALAVIDPEEGPEVLTVDLTSAGYVAAPGEVFIKDWSEHEGLAKSLASAGVVEPIGTVTVNPFGSTAYRARVLV